MAVQTRRRCPRHANRTSAFRTSVVSSTVRRLSGSPRCTPKHSRELEGPPLFSPAPSFASRAPSCRRFVTSRAALSSLRGPAAVRGKYLVKIFSAISVDFEYRRRAGAARRSSAPISYLVTVTML